MSELQVTLWASVVGAVVGSACSLVGMLVNSRLTQGRERRQQVWQTELDRIITLEERAGQLVELIGSHGDPQHIRVGASEQIEWLSSAAGRFRKHKGIMQAIRDLDNGLRRLLEGTLRHEDCEQTRTEVNSLYDKLLSQCDSVTGKRRL